LEADDAPHGVLVAGRWLGRWLGMGGNLLEKMAVFYGINGRKMEVFS